MDRKTVAICGTIVLLGILAASAGFAAEVTRLKPSEVQLHMEHCVYPRRRSLSIGLALLAALITSINKNIIIILFGWFPCDPQSISHPAAAFVSSISWIISVTGECLFELGVVQNFPHREHKDGIDTLTCYVVQPWVFGAAAVCSILGAMFGVVGYIFVSSANKLTTSPIDLERDNNNNINVEENRVLQLCP